MLNAKYSNVLITGGAGFIGSNIALKLIKNGYSVTILDNLSEQIHGKNAERSPLYLSIKNKVKFIHGSVTEREDWYKSLRNQDVIIHLAAETGTGQSMYEIEKYCTSNITGTAILLDILANENNSIKKVLVASSRAIYGEGKYFCEEHGSVYPVERNDAYMKNGDFSVRCPICNRIVELCATDEESKIHPSSMYGITKQAEEEMVHCICKAIGIPSVSFRYQNVYGPGQSLKNPYTGILSIFSNSLRQNNQIDIFEDGEESRDFVYIDDVVDATILAMEKEESAYQTFNIGTGVSTDVLSVAHLLKHLYNSGSIIKISGKYRKGDIRHNYANIEKAKRLLGFAPKVTFEEGLKHFCKWVETQPIEEDRYQKSLDEMKQKGLYR